MSSAGALIVGGSRAGLSVAVALRKGGYDERIRIVGDEEHLPYDRPAVSKDLLLGKKSVADLLLVGPESLETIEFSAGRRAVELDLGTRTVGLDTGERAQFDVLFLATGSAPIWPTGLPRIQGVHTIRGVNDSLALRSELDRAHNIVVVGGGFIGAEIASAARSLGKDAHIIQSGPALLTRVLGQDFGSAWGEVHRAHGTVVSCGVTVTSLLEVDGRVAGVVLSDGRKIDADLVVIGVGARPATDWLDGSGLTIRDGIVCDEYLVAAPGIYAVGDVARWQHPLYGVSTRVEHWTNAHEQGTAAAMHHLGRGRPFANIPYVWSDQYGKRLQVYGTTTGATHSRILSTAEDGTPRVMVYGRAGRLVAALGVDAPRDLLPLRKALAQNADWESVAQPA
ncbi:FAD-dependent oxidoreductase [Nocardia sp. R6R-6]|uniref:FAD-dependent oxidoreductase n=1 Tax=Nocardia sp. R6R-6 TaxID=3459303 RepID=UPI00403D84EB